MFMNDKFFKKLVTEAYKTFGLTIAMQDRRYVFAGDGWCFKVRPDCLTNKAKAAVVELIRDLPNVEGEGYIIKKGKCEKDFPDEAWLKISSVTGDEEILENLNLTGVMVQESDETYRVYQLENKRILYLKDQFTNAVNESEINRRLELPPVGPVKWKKEHDMVYWYSNSCQLWVTPSHIIGIEDIRKRLEEINLVKESTK